MLFRFVEIFNLCRQNRFHLCRCFNSCRQKRVHSCRPLCAGGFTHADNWTGGGGYERRRLQRKCVTFCWRLLTESPCHCWRLQRNRTNVLRHCIQISILCHVCFPCNPNQKCSIAGITFSLKSLCINGFDCVWRTYLMRHGMSKQLHFEDKTRKNLLFEPKVYHYYFAFSLIRLKYAAS